MNSALIVLRFLIVSAFFFVISLTSDCDIESLIRVSEKQGQDQTPGVGERLLLRENAFVEKILPGSILRKLSDEEMEVYRAPFPDEMSRIPTLRFPNELPIEGSPWEVHEALTGAHEALKVSTYPKVLFVGNPGALVSPVFARSFVRTLRNCDLVELGDGAHYLQEDHPQAIAEGVVKLIRRTEMQREASITA